MSLEYPKYYISVFARELISLQYTNIQWIAFCKGIPCDADIWVGLQKYVVTAPLYKSSSYVGHEFEPHSGISSEKSQRTLGTTIKMSSQSIRQLLRYLCLH